MGTTIFVRQSQNHICATKPICLFHHLSFLSLGMLDLVASVAAANGGDSTVGVCGLVATVAGAPPGWVAPSHATLLVRKSRNQPGKLGEPVAGPCSCPVGSMVRSPCDALAAAS